VAQAERSEVPTRSSSSAMALAVPFGSGTARWMSVSVIRVSGPAAEAAARVELPGPAVFA
jgi:hypothetical protein